MKDYDGTRAILGLIELIGWISFIIGVCLVFYSLIISDSQDQLYISRASSYFMYGMIIASSGIIYVAISRVSSAIIDCAENSTKILDLLSSKNSADADSDNKNLDLEDTNVDSAHLDEGNDLNNNVFEIEENLQDEHKSRGNEKIVCIDNKYYVDGKQFSTIDDARQYTRGNR